MINPEHKLSLTKQAKALGISRGNVYYLPRPVSDRDQALMKRNDRLHLEFPFAGAPACYEICLTRKVSRLGASMCVL